MLPNSRPDTWYTRDSPRYGIKRTPDAALSISLSSRRALVCGCVALVIQYTAPALLLLWLRVVHKRHVARSLWAAVALKLM